MQLNKSTIYSFATTAMNKVFFGFFLFGLVNNILYVIILSAAIDIVGESTPKALVLLADIVPAFCLKLLAPFFVHLIPYNVRVFLVVIISFFGMMSVSLISSISGKIFGIALASLASGLGEMTFLQFSHFYDSKSALGGFASGTGGAGLLGSFYYLLLSNVFHIQSWIILLASSLLPFTFIYTYYLVLPPFEVQFGYETIANTIDMEDEDSTTIKRANQSFKQFFTETFCKIKPLIIPYMIPLILVYLSEYTINQGVSPTLLFPLNQVPKWLFASYRDMYVVYGFVYQLGVFVSRSSINFSVRIRKLYLMSVLQVVNLVILIIQSMFNVPFPNIWLLSLFIFYEGLLGGFSYINTFMSVSEEVSQQDREFSMGSVSMADSLGIVIAGGISWWLEPSLCNYQVSHGRDWCLGGN